MPTTISRISPGRGQEEAALLQRPRQGHGFGDGGGRLQGDE